MSTHPASRKQRKQVGDFILEKAIGFGAFSTVYEGINVETKHKVAVKSINLHRINVSEKHLSNLKQEIDILRKCRHTNIVQLLHTYQTTNHIYLIMQFCGGGDLHRFVQRNGRMSEANAQRFSMQLAAGLQYLHSEKIIHRDLKPQNILLSVDSYDAIVRIADFGFARYKPTGHNMVDTMCGSPLYMAPEILKFNKYDSKVDLWSAGTIIYQMVCKDPPFNGANHIELLKKIENCKRLRFPPGLSDEYKDLIVRLLKRIPTQRISWEAFFGHAWLNTPSQMLTQTRLPRNNNSNGAASMAQSNTPTPYDYAESDNNNNDKSASNRSSNHYTPRASTASNKHTKIQPPPTTIAAVVANGHGTHGTPEAFVLIDNASNSPHTPRTVLQSTSASSTNARQKAAVAAAAMNSKNYKEFVSQCGTAYEQLRTQFAFAKSVMKVGDVQTSKEQISCALLLYLRGLDILESVVVAIQSWITTYTASHLYLQSKLKHRKKAASEWQAQQTRMDEHSVLQKQLLLDCIGCYDDHWKRGEAIQTLCCTQHLGFDVDRVNIDEVIFQFAINLAMKSCSDIILNIDERTQSGGDQDTGSRNKIQQCQTLLLYLMTLDGIEERDKHEIQKYLNAIQETMKVIENL